MIFSVKPGTQSATAVMIESLDPESFVLRAEGEMDASSAYAVADLQYAIEIDPQHKLSESDRSDNVSCVLLRVSVSARTVSVLNPNSCASATVTSITPASARVGQSVSVTITGTGFAAGVAVSFANGNGAAPSFAGSIATGATGFSLTVSARWIDRLRQ